MDDTVSEVKRVAKKVQKNPVVRNLEKRAVKKGADFLRGALPRVPERVGMRMKPRLWWLCAVCAAAAGGEESKSVVSAACPQTFVVTLKLMADCAATSHTFRLPALFSAGAESPSAPCTIKRLRAALAEEQPFGAGTGEGKRFYTDLGFLGGTNCPVGQVFFLFPRAVFVLHSM